MKYKITIKSLKETIESKYPIEEEVFSQIIEGDEKTILDIIKATNGLMTKE